MGEFGLGVALVIFRSEIGYEAVGKEVGGMGSTRDDFVPWKHVPGHFRTIKCCSFLHMPEIKLSGKVVKEYQGDHLPKFKYF